MGGTEMKEWYLNFDGKVIGPFGKEEIAAMASQGRLRPTDLLKKSANGEWSEAQKTEALASVVQFTQTSSSSPRGGPPRNAPNPANQAQYDVLQDALSNASRGWFAIGLFVTRIIQSDFKLVRATEKERETLLSATPPISNPLAQNYSAWRRSVLTVTSLLLVANALLTIQNFQLFPAEYGIYNRVMAFAYDAMLFGTKIISAVLVTMAAFFWGDVKRSKKLARFSWIFLVFAPALLLAIPIEKLLDLDGGQTAYVASLLTVAVLLNFLPSVVGIFPGIIRALLTLKTLLPESQAPGWAVVIFAPIYSLFFIVALSISARFITAGMLFLGVVLLAIAPLTYVFQSRSLTASHDPSEASNMVRRLRRTSGVFTFSGIAIFLWLFLRNIGIEEWTFMTLIQTSSGLLSSILLITVVAADFCLAALRTGYEQSRSFYGSERQMRLNQKFESLTSVGLTDLAAGEAELAKTIGVGVGEATKKSLDWAANQRFVASATENEQVDNSANQSSVKKLAGAAAVIFGILLWFGGEIIQIQPYNVVGIPIVLVGAVFYIREHWRGQ
ncbi:DUF4339 domain-containing protein [Mariniblastus sp.]|nr:DUF4339 domain-containing protein [Mariniblastus sp.]